MDIERAVADFVHRGRDLFDRLRAEGQTLSPLGLHIFRTQLHILHVEAARLKREQATERATAKTKVGIAAQAQTKALHSTCTHRRLIDDHFDEKGNRTGLYYCLECRAVIKGPAG